MTPVDLDWRDNFKLSFIEDYPGDRVHAFMSALLTMTMASYDHKQTFFGDSLDAQKLYNSARNIETAVWKLSNAKTPKGLRICLPTAWMARCRISASSVS